MKLKNRLFLRLSSTNGTDIRVNPKDIRKMWSEHEYMDSEQRISHVDLGQGSYVIVFETLDDIEKQVDDLENRGRMLDKNYLEDAILDALARHARLDALNRHSKEGT